MAIATNLKNLVRLNLSKLRVYKDTNRIGNNTGVAIANNLPHLTHLSLGTFRDDLDECELEKEAALGIARNLKHLQVLSMSKEPLMQEATITRRTIMLRSGSSCPISNRVCGDADEKCEINQSSILLM